MTLAVDICRDAATQIFQAAEYALMPETYINLELQVPLREIPVAKMKATLLTWALPLLFAGAVVAQNTVGRVSHSDDCLACPCTDCDVQRHYDDGAVSTAHLPVSDLY